MVFSGSGGVSWRVDERWKEGKGGEQSAAEPPYGNNTNELGHGFCGY